ncbi:MAG: hypothetical protein N2316_01490 [Spirochaetes bacterium]|nr:hypothetical protein [Spirochaetota bacterium]
MKKNNSEIERYEVMSESELISEIQREKIQKLLQKSTRTLEEIKEACERIDVVKLYSGKVIEGAIIEQGEKYKIMTTTGVINVSRKEVRTVTVVR